MECDSYANTKVDDSISADSHEVSSGHRRPTADARTRAHRQVPSLELVVTTRWSLRSLVTVGAPSCTRVLGAISSAMSCARCPAQLSIKIVGSREGKHCAWLVGEDSDVPVGSGEVIVEQEVPDVELAS